MAKRRMRYLSEPGTADRAIEKARIAAQCKLSAQLAADPRQIEYVIGYLTHASLPGVIDRIGELAREYIDTHPT